MNTIYDQMVQDSYELARQAKQYFDDWQAGRVYIAKPALRAMGRRYLYLRDKSEMTMLELYEFGRLYAFFALLYPDGDLPSPADTAVEFCNLLSGKFAIAASLVSGGGE